MTLTLPKLKRLLKTRFKGILKSGQHPQDGEACVRELRACALELPWNDHPDGAEASPTDRACQVLNDANWSSDEARAKGCLPLALLTESDAAEGWVKAYALETVRVIVPIALRAAASVNPSSASRLEEAALACEAAKNSATARAADAASADAAHAAARAADAAYDDAAHAAARAADAAYDASARAAADAAYDAAARAADASDRAAADAAYAAARVRAADASADAARAAVRAADAARAARAAHGDAVLLKAVALLIACHKGEKP